MPESCDFCNRPRHEKAFADCDVCCQGCGDQQGHTAECGAYVGNRAEVAAGQVTGALASPE